MKSAIILLAAALASAPQDKKDRVVLKKGPTIEGVVQKDTWKAVVLAAGTGQQTIKADDILAVEYYDAPSAFQGAMQAIAQEKWAEALSSLASAKEYAESRERGVVKPRAWFPAYLTFYRGRCLKESGRSADALKEFEKIRKEFKESRFLTEAYELAMETYSDNGDAAAMEAFKKEIAAAPAELQPKLNLLAERQQAELLYNKSKYAEARKLFEKIALSTDKEIAAEGTAGVIKCLSGLKDTAALEAHCQRVLATASEPSLKLLASNGLGDIAFDKGQFAAARDHYIASVVKFNPGRTGSGVEREHERALYRLGQCYEKMIEAAKDAGPKDALSRMASSAYRELSIEYPSGKYREEAAAKADKYDSSDKK